MLCFDAIGVLHRHVPAGKGHHAGIMGAMKCMKWCLFYAHAIPHGSRQKAIYHAWYRPPLSRNLRDLPVTGVAVSNWLGHGRAGPATGCPRRWALPCHFPDCSRERVLLPESFRGVAPSVDPASPVLILMWQRGRSPLSCIEHENASAVHSSAQVNDVMPSWLHDYLCASGSILSWGACLRKARGIPI